MDSYKDKLSKLCKNDVNKNYKEYYKYLYKVLKKINKLYKNKNDISEVRLLLNELYADELVKEELFYKNDSELEKYMSYVLYYAYSIIPYVCTENIELKAKYDKYTKFRNFMIEVIEALKEENCNLILKLIKENANNNIKSNLKLYLDNQFVNDKSCVYRTIVNSENLNTYDYLYKYGYKITEKHWKLVDYFNKISNDKIKDMAICTANGFFRGYKSANLNICEKTYITLFYPIGFEKVALEFVKYVKEAYGLTTLLRVIEEPFNKQIEYAHRNDWTLFYDEEYTKNRTDVLNKLLEKEKYQELSLCAGNVYIETFGEELFNPKSICVFESSKEKETLLNNYRVGFCDAINKAKKKDETSFCIISYPCPEISKDKFEEIFDEVVKINTLDNNKYMNIQKTIIDELDKCEVVKIVGKNGNKTDLTISLHELKDNQTNFENCTADVNIPVGEVFTSPVLKGTNGVLNVSKVYLRGLEYKDLEIVVEDGMVKSYNCSNFDEEKDNLDFINENIMNFHDSLPMGEFAIGTNTNAYVMARKYNIEDKLDILIAEKTGPHFAFGDTCYSRREHIKVYNPDGKEIIAKDNECSILRETTPEKAYFNCHTDVTIPYDEIGKIYGIDKEGNEHVIIENGLFVLEGTEELNLDEMK